MVPTPAARRTPPDPYDRVIHAGRVVCPAAGLDGPGAVAIVGDRIAAAGPRVDGPAHEVLRFPDAVVLPGLVDLHAHPNPGESRYGVDPDLHLLPFGTTTVLAQGEAGALDLVRYLETVIDRSLTRVRLAVNISRRGEATPGGSCEAREDVDGLACAAAVRAARRTGAHAIWGIAVNVSRATCGGTDPRTVLREGLAAASATGLPLLFGPRRAEDWALKEQLALLRPGDVVTYCFSDCAEGATRRGWPGPGRGLGGPGAGRALRRGPRDGLVQLPGGGAGRGAGLPPRRHLDRPLPATPQGVAAS